MNLSLYTGHHVLETAYNRPTPARQVLLGRIACFRSPVKYETLKALAEGAASPTEEGTAAVSAAPVGVSPAGPRRREADEFGGDAALSGRDARAPRDVDLRELLRLRFASTATVAPWPIHLS